MLTASDHVASDDVVRNALWRRAFAAFNYGDVLVTMGTGKMTQNEEEGMGLAGEHDYAVIDMKERDGQRFFLLKNPWSEGITWKGHLFLTDSMNEAKETLNSPGVTDNKDSDNANDSCLAPGTFWMGLNDVFQSFESIYLNWNPRLFSYKEDIHFNWDLSTCNSPEGSCEFHPQCVVRSRAGDAVWILLSRHYTSSGQGLGEGMRMPTSNVGESGFINLCAFDNGGTKAICSDGATVHGPYVDSPNALLKLEMPAAKAFTIVVSEQGLPRSRIAFTLSAYSPTPLGVAEAHEKFAYSVSQHGAWTASTAGGNASGSLYYTNPQFSLRLVDTSDLSLVLESPVESVPIHVKLVWAKGKQIHSIATRDVVGDSGEYKKGFALATMFGIQAGIYTVVCSTFEQGQLGSFTLRVKSMSPCTLEEISTVAAGRFVTKAQSAVFSPGKMKLLARLQSWRLNRVSTTVSCCGKRSGSGTCTCSPLRLSLEYGQGPWKRILGSSGEDKYLGGRTGVHCPEVDIQPSMCEAGGVWIVIERLAPSSLEYDEHVNVEILSDGPIEVYEWMVGEGQ